MSKLFNKLNQSETVFAFFASFITLFILYPRLFLGLDYVMGQGTWELQDPATSSLVFIPGARMLSYELFQNSFNFLWSSTRGYGQPILGNDIQAAPLFPLTLLFRIFPEPYFWQFFVLSRLILLGGFCFLFAREILKRTRTGAFVFMLCFGFSVHVVRWTNHAWQSGFLTSVMYLYFAAKIIQEFPKVRTRLAIGLIVSLYCVITSGFPEASIMGAFLSLFILLPQLLSKFRRPKKLVSFLILFIILNGIGLLLASPQLFGICEILLTSVNQLSFRGAGAGQFKSLSIFWAFITRLTDGPPKSDIVHYFNLIPLFLFLVGILKTVAKREKSWIVWSSLFCFSFYILKNFPIWPWFNTFIGTLPVLSTVWFFVYFLPILLFPFAHFASEGVDYILENNEGGWKSTFLFLIVASEILFVLVRAAELEPALSISRTVRLTVIFMAFVFSLSLHPLSKNLSKKNWVSFAIISFLIGELATVRPIHYMKFTEEGYTSQFSHVLPTKLKALLVQHGLNPIEMRDRSSGGTFAEIGVTSINNGSAPIIPPRPSTFINSLFKTWDGWGAAMPVQGQRVPYAFRLASNNLHVIENEDPNYGMVDDREWVKLGRIGTFNVFHDPLALPRSYIAQRCFNAKNSEAAIKLLSDPKRFSLGTVVLENLTQKEAEICNQYQKANVEKVALLEDRGKTLKLTTVKGPVVLVLNDSYYPDWYLIDEKSGESLSIKPANYNFRGVLLTEEKEYDLRFEYRPRWLPLSQKLVLLGLALVCLLLLIKLLEERKITRISMPNPNRDPYTL